MLQIVLFTIFTIAILFINKENNNLRKNYEKKASTLSIKFEGKNVESVFDQKFSKRAFSDFLSMLAVGLNIYYILIVAFSEVKEFSYIVDILLIALNFIVLNLLFMYIGTLRIYTVDIFNEFYMESIKTPLNYENVNIAYQKLRYIKLNGRNHILYNYLNNVETLLKIVKESNYIPTNDDMDIELALKYPYAKLMDADEVFDTEKFLYKFNNYYGKKIQHIKKMFDYENLSSYEDGESLNKYLDSLIVEIYEDFEATDLQVNIKEKLSEGKLWE